MQLKNNRLYIISGCTVFILILTIVLALYKTHLAMSHGNAVSKSNIWTLPVSSVVVYFIYSIFIKNPQILVKKSLEEYENPDLNLEKRKKSIHTWKIIYYYLRLLTISIFAILSV